MSIINLKHPPKIAVRVNSDEVLIVHVQGMRLLNDKLLQVAGLIDIEDSRIMTRANLPGIWFLARRMYVVEYHEYEHKKDDVCIECQITFSETNPAAR